MRWAFLMLLLSLTWAIPTSAQERLAFGNILGTVVNAAGQPVPDVTVNLYIAPMNAKKRAEPLADGEKRNRAGKIGGKQISVATATTDFRGTFVMANVPVGEYVLNAKAAGGSDTKFVTVSEGGKIPVVMTLQAGGGGKKRERATP